MRYLAIVLAFSSILTAQVAPPKYEPQLHHTVRSHHDAENMKQRYQDLKCALVIIQIPNSRITTDGFVFYRKGVEDVFAGQADFAQMIKLYGDYGQHDAAGRYSPAPMLETIIKIRDGRPDPRHISTSYVERQNLTIRMAIRRFTRLTNAFSKKLDNHKAACALHFAYYNFCRIHKSLRVTPAMEAGLTDHLWTIRELVSHRPRSQTLSGESQSGQRGLWTYRGILTPPCYPRS